MTICELVLQANIPKDSRYPKTLTSIGDHLRTKRLDGNMELKDVAQQLNVTVQSIVHWEQNRTTPNLRFYPVIADFLGYETPVMKENNKLVGMLKNYRKENGVSLYKCSKRIGLTHTTLHRIETGRTKLTEKSKHCLQVFFQDKAKKLATLEKDVTKFL